MDFSGFIDSVISFTQNYTVVAIALVLGLFFFTYRKPKLFFTLLFLGLFVAGVFYLIANTAGSGSEKKKRLLSEEKQSDVIP